MRHPATTVCKLSVVMASLLLLPASATAVPFAPATPVAGFGDEPALAQVGGAALAANGASVVAGTADSAGNRRAVAAFEHATRRRPPRVASDHRPAPTISRSLPTPPATSR